MRPWAREILLLGINLAIRPFKNLSRLKAREPGSALRRLTRRPEPTARGPEPESREFHWPRDLPALGWRGFASRGIPVSYDAQRRCKLVGEEPFKRSGSGAGVPGRAPGSRAGLRGPGPGSGVPGRSTGPGAGLWGPRPEPRAPRNQENFFYYDFASGVGPGGRGVAPGLRPTSVCVRREGRVVG